MPAEIVNFTEYAKRVIEREERQLAPGGKPPHDGGPMADEITRPELDAKLELIETRMDARADRIEGVVRNMVDKIDILTRETTETRRESRSHRTQILGMGVGVIVAIIAMAIALIIGITQLLPELHQSAGAIFESGRATGRAQSESTAKGELASPTKNAPLPSSVNP